FCITGGVMSPAHHASADLRRPGDTHYTLTAMQCADYLGYPGVRGCSTPHQAAGDFRVLRAGGKTYRPCTNFIVFRVQSGADLRFVRSTGTHHDLQNPFVILSEVTLKPAHDDHNHDSQRQSGESQRQLASSETQSDDRDEPQHCRGRHAEYEVILPDDRS